MDAPTGRDLIRLSTPLPCRYCRLPSYLAEADDDKRLHPLHPCCRFWIGQEGKATCVACANFNSRRSGARTKSRTDRTDQVVPGQKSFDEDEGLLLVLAFLRRAGGWVHLVELQPFVGRRVDLLAQLSVVVEQRGTYYRIAR